MERIKELIEKCYEDVVRYRRKIHQNPELGGYEVKTSELIAEELEKMGIEVKKGFAKTGIQGMIYGDNPNGKTIMIRADIDALPIEEKNECNYRSLIKGVMHACGHDVHTAILLGTAKVLSEMKDVINGNVKFCFQPSEEGPGGATEMIKDGIMENPKVDYTIGLHVDPSLKFGEIAVEGGPISAYPRFFDITFKGKGGHGSFPSKSVDPILPAVEAYNMINSIHKKINPLEPCVVQVCQFNAGMAPAAIPNEARIAGTTRTVTKETRDLLERDIRKIAEDVSKLYGVQYEFKYCGGAQPIINDLKYSEKIKESIKNVFEKGFAKNETIKLAADDFCWYADHSPVTYMLLGTSTEDKKTQYPVHNPNFDIDETVMKKGIEAFVRITIDYLNEEYDK